MSRWDEYRLPSPSRIVVLASGAGSVMQALLDACATPDFGAQVVAVGSDRADAGALTRADAAGVDSFCVPFARGDDRAVWDAALTERVAGFTPDLVALVGFMRLNGPTFLGEFGGKTINTHPALSPAFPGMHGPRDALSYGVKVTGATIFLVDPGVDEGPVVAQRAVPVADDDSVDSLHDRIKTVERDMLVDTIGRMVRHGWRINGRKVELL